MIKERNSLIYEATKTLNVFLQRTIYCTIYQNITFYMTFRFEMFEVFLTFNVSFFFVPEL